MWVIQLHFSRNDFEVANCSIANNGKLKQLLMRSLFCLHEYNQSNCFLFFVSSENYLSTFGVYFEWMVSDDLISVLRSLLKIFTNMICQRMSIRVWMIQSQLPRKPPQPYQLGRRQLLLLLLLRGKLQHIQWDQDELHLGQKLNQTMKVLGTPTAFICHLWHIISLSVTWILILFRGFFFFLI